MSQPEDEDTKEHTVAAPPPPPPSDTDTADDAPLGQTPSLMPPSITAAPDQTTPVPAPAWQEPAAHLDARPPTEPVPTPPVAPPATPTAPAGQSVQQPVSQPTQGSSQQWQPTAQPQPGPWQQPTQPSGQTQQPTQWQQPPAQPWQGSPQHPSHPGWAPQQGYPPQSGYPPQGYPQPGYPQQGYAPAGPIYSASALVAVAGLLLAVFGLLAMVGGVWLLGQGGELQRFIQQTTVNLFGSRLDQSTLRAVLSPMPGVLLVVGALQVILGAGIFAHKGWARALGILLALLGILVGIAGVGFALALAPGSSVPLIAAIVTLLGYAFIFLALTAGGAHFYRRYPQR